MKKTTTSASAQPKLTITTNKTVAETINSAFISYLCSYGDDQQSLFRDRPDLKEAYTVLKEATTKSTRERLLRHTRMPNVDPMGGKKQSYNTMRGRTTPKKTGNNDPKRGGNPILHNQRTNFTEDLKQSMSFLADFGKKNFDAVAEFQYKLTLLKVVNHLIACGLGGWREEDGRYINESDQCAAKRNWNLTEDGRLAPKGKKPVSYDIDWLLEVRDVLQRALSE